LNLSIQYFFKLISLLGTRFVHTSEGRFLVTRLVPCGQCLIDADTTIVNNVDVNVGKSNENVHDINFEDAFKRAPRVDAINIRPRASQESATSDGDSGVDPDSTGIVVSKYISNQYRRFLF
jgi:hypothetical protein